MFWQQTIHYGLSRHTKTCTVPREWPIKTGNLDLMVLLNFNSIAYRFWRHACNMHTTAVDTSAKAAFASITMCKFHATPIFSPNTTRQLFSIIHEVITIWITNNHTIPFNTLPQIMIGHFYVKLSDMYMYFKLLFLPKTHMHFITIPQSIKQIGISLKPDVSSILRPNASRSCLLLFHLLAIVS